MVLTEVLPGYRSNALERRAFDVMTLLEERGSETSAGVCEALSLSKSQVSAAIEYARVHLCPQLNVTIPHPVPNDGFRYRVTGEWIGKGGDPAIGAGASYAMAQIESRLRSVHRDVLVALNNLEPRSLDGRRANFLNKHLSRIFGTLDVIASPAQREHDVI